MRVRLVKRFDNLKKLERAIDPAVGIVLEAWATDTQINWQNKMLTSPPTGITYYSRVKPSPHTASSPGNPPRVWTSEYYDSVRVEKINDLAYETMTDTPYAGELEFVLNRPVMLPTAMEAEGRVDKYIGAIGKHLP